MAKSKLVQMNQKIEKTVVEGYKAIEDAVVGGYKEMEDTVVCGFNNVNDKVGKARNHKVKVHAGQTVVALWNKNH